MARYVLIEGQLRDVGRLREPTEVDVDGREVRCISAGYPEGQVRSETFVTRDGTVRQRFYNWVDGTHSWSEPKEVSEHGTVPIGTTQTGGRALRVSVQRAIALAWIDLPPHIRAVGEACVAIVDPSGCPYDCANLGWLARRDVRRRRAPGFATPPPTSGEDSDSESSDPDEEWRPLVYTRQTVGTLVRSFDVEAHGHVEVSSEGRVRNELGPLRPVADGTVDVGVFGSVPVADAVAQSFGMVERASEVSAASDASSLCGVATDGASDVRSIRLVPRAPPSLRPAERQVFDAVCHGEPVREIARARGCAVSTVYCHLVRALSAIELSEVPVRVWLSLLPAPLRDAVDEMYADRESVLGDTLTECRDEVTRRVARMGPDARRQWEECDCQWSALRIARLYAMRAAMHARCVRAAG